MSKAKQLKVFERKLTHRNGSFYLNVPAALVRYMNAKEGDLFEIYAGIGGVFTVGRSTQNDRTPISPEERNPHNPF